ncbi:MAG: STAS domain-containing protein [Terriglobales bacterium]
MARLAEQLKIDEGRVVEALQAARERLDRVEGEMVLDFSSVRRIDPCALRAMEELADTADHQGVKLVLQDVNVAAYKVLKLVKLASRFCFAS